MNLRGFLCVVCFCCLVSNILAFNCLNNEPPITRNHDELCKQGIEACVMIVKETGYAVWHCDRDGICKNNIQQGYGYMCCYTHMCNFITNKSSSVAQTSGTVAATVVTPTSEAVEATVLTSTPGAVGATVATSRPGTVIATVVVPTSGAVGVTIVALKMLLLIELALL
ncbi:unnamed protein product [Bursaphelenchus xylophilus]|uniref:(pine wood nematode) hypothetical protein n=1 Tax=Bursaphelenchus xylophilus TaxID=6326 RepID=A0A1I7RP15_BURXY|nr:unnamed protein product [Bursaphelenchus xylophilus]CAG9124450.1 unnamed protein product [Bursaphelenchus xylophilus]